VKTELYFEKTLSQTHTHTHSHTHTPGRLLSDAHTLGRLGKHTRSDMRSMRSGSEVGGHGEVQRAGRGPEI